MLIPTAKESDLIYGRGKFYLALSCAVADPKLVPVEDFLGIDLGVVNIATDSDRVYSGSMVKNLHFRHRKT